MSVVIRPFPALFGHYRFVPGPDDLPYALLAEVATNARQGDVLCEVGAYMGRATCYLMECLQSVNSPAKLYAFDLFGETPEPRYGEGRDDTLMPWGEPFEKWAERSGGKTAIYDAFQFYTQQSPARDYLYDYIQVPSARGGDDFADQSLAFVYLHYSRRPDCIRQDLEGWWPKVRVGGRLAVEGEDRSTLSAVQAVCTGASLLMEHSDMGLTVIARQ